MGLKKTKRLRIPVTPREETVKIADLVRDYNEILDGVSKLSKSKRDLVVARVEKLKERGLIKLQSEVDASTQPIEEQVAQILNEKTNPKDIN